MCIPAKLSRHKFASIKLIFRLLYLYHFGQT
jgi:hypothetical protein